MKKRIIAMLTAFVLVNSISLFSVFEVSANVSLNDEYINKSNVLLAICPQMPIGDEGTYTRAEFVAAVTELLNLPIYGESSGFLDVASDHKYASNINAGVNIGLINSQNMFYPDDPITYAQAIKIVTAAIGYSVRAEVLGGYPTGYLLAANEAQIGVGMQFANNDHLSYTDGVELLYDMAVADILQMTGVGDTVKYSTVKGKNILSVYHDINIYEEILNANEFTGLYSKNQHSSKGRVKIGQTEFLGGDFHELIGQKVRAFYKNDKVRTLIWAYPLDNEVHKFSSDYMLKLSGLDLTVQSPDKASKDIKLSLEAGYSVIYNGKNLVASNYAPYLNPNAGNVTLIDNDEDGIYDVILIEEIQYGYIDKVNVLGKKIYDKYQSDSMIDLSDPDTKYYIYDANGNSIGIDDIKANTVAGYIVSTDKKLVVAHLYNKVYGGIISEKTSDGKIKIRDNYYEISDYYKSIKTLNELSLGAEVICHIGEGDDIVYLEHISGESKYGFLVDIGMQLSGIEKKVFIKVMTSDEGMVVLTLADKVNINGIVKEKFAASVDVDTIKSKADKYRTIKYFVNEKGEVNKIYSAVDVTDLSQVFDESTDDDAPKAFVSYNCYYVEGILSPYIRPASSSSVIMIPQNDADKLDDTKYEALNSSAFKASTSYNIIAYDVDEGGIPKFILVYGNASLTDVSEETASAIVEKVYNTIDDDGNVVDCIKAFSQGSYQFFYITDKTPVATKTALQDVAPGDIVRLSYNGDKEITAALHDYDISTRTSPQGLDQTGVGMIVEYINGYIYGLSGTYAMVVPRNTDFTQPVSPLCSIIVNLGRGTTVYCKINKDRQGNVIDAEVYTEPDLSTIETWCNSGTDADYLVARQRFRQSDLNVIYVD